MLAILVRFTSPTIGVVIRVLDVIGIVGETAEKLSKEIWGTIEEYGLKEKLIALCADNASSSFGGATRGGHNNVLQRISEKCDKRIYGIGCLCHIVNNSISTNNLSLFDPINIPSMLKLIYAFFNRQTVRINAFEEMCKNNFDEHGDLDRIIPKLMPSYSATRWLSLCPALQVLIEMFPMYKRYFTRFDSPEPKDTENVRKLKEFFNDEKSFIYSLILYEISHSFHQTVKKLETSKNNIVECLAHVHELLTTLNKEKTYYKDKHPDVAHPVYLPNRAKQVIYGWDTLERDSLLKKIDTFYASCSSYIKKWMAYTVEFDELRLEWFRDGNLDNQKIRVTLNNLETKGMLVKMGIEKNELFRDLIFIKNFMNAHPGIVVPDTDCHSFWTEVIDRTKLEWNQDLKCFEIFLQFFCSLPGHNADNERVFSQINMYWSDQKSRMLVTSVRDFAQAKFNLIDDGKSIDMFNYISQNEDLRIRVATERKYYFASLPENKKRDKKNKDQNSATQDTLEAPEVADDIDDEAGPSEAIENRAYQGNAINNVSDFYN